MWGRLRAASNISDLLIWLLVIRSVFAVCHFQLHMWFWRGRGGKIIVFKIVVVVNGSSKNVDYCVRWWYNLKWLKYYNFSLLNWYGEELEQKRVLEEKASSKKIHQSSISAYWIDLQRSNYLNGVDCGSEYEPLNLCWYCSKMIQNNE